MESKVKELRTLLAEAHARSKEPTPEFFKKWRRWMILLAAVGALTTPILGAFGLVLPAAVSGALTTGALASAKTAKHASTTR